MNKEQFQEWQKGVKEHISHLNNTVEERKILKEILENHLKQFFNFDEIEYDREFQKILLKWDRIANPVIRNDNIGNLGMDWIIRADYDDQAFRIVVIEIYPFGLERGLQEEI